MYSLVSAGVLAVDLARHPSGTAVADVVDRVLALDGNDLARLGEPAPESVRSRVLEVCAGRQRASGALQHLATMNSLESSSAALTMLSEVLIGSLEDLLSLLRREPPLASAEPAAVLVALDAVTAAWAGREADFHDLAALRAPWAAGVAAAPPSLPEAPWSEPLRRLLDEVPHRTSEQWRRSVLAHRGTRATSRWSLAMHDACFAVWEADRVVDVARAQLAGARALRLSAASTGPDAQANGMVLAAAVQAVCAADLLDTASLIGSWSAGS